MQDMFGSVRRSLVFRSPDGGRTKALPSEPYSSNRSILVSISDERLQLMAYIVLSKLRHLQWFEQRRSSSLLAMADAAHPAFILETRKTAPGLRLVDKWVVLIGGGRNHIMRLFDMVMNHISVVGGLKDALRSVGLYLEKNNLHMGVE
ncbi:unnamed protein product [Camellia sinensis]